MLLFAVLHFFVLGLIVTIAGFYDVKLVCGDCLFITGQIFNPLGDLCGFTVVNSRTLINKVYVHMIVIIISK